VFKRRAYQPGSQRRGILMSHRLTNVVQSGENGRSVYRAWDPNLLTEEDIDEVNNLEESLGSLIGSGSFNHYMEEYIKEAFEIWDFVGSEKENFSNAISEGRFAEFLSSKYWKMKLVGVIRAKTLLDRMEEFMADHEDGFKRKYSTIVPLKNDIEAVQEELEPKMSIMRQQIIADIIGEKMDRIDLSIKLKKLQGYLQSEEFEEDLEGMNPEERSNFVQERMAVLSALLPNEAVEKTNRKAMGALFKAESNELLVSDNVKDREGALQRLLEGEGDSTYRNVASDIIQEAGSTAAIAKGLNKGLEELQGARVTPDRWKQALDRLGETRASRFVQRLEAKSVFGSFVAAATLYSLDWPQDVQGTIYQSGGVAALAGTAPDIGKVFGVATEGVEATKFGRALKFLGRWMGPASDLFTAVADSINSYRQFDKGDYGAGAVSALSAGGVAIGGVIAVSGSTGTGFVAGPGAGLIGAGISWLWGESELESQLENMDLVEDTNVDYIPGI
jgi:hypothetical protein